MFGTLEASGETYVRASSRKHLSQVERFRPVSPQEFQGFAVEQGFRQDQATSCWDSCTRSHLFPLHIRTNPKLMRGPSRGGGRGGKIPGARGPRGPGPAHFEIEDDGFIHKMLANINVRALRGIYRKGQEVEGGTCGVTTTSWRDKGKTTAMSRRSMSPLTAEPEIRYLTSSNLTWIAWSQLACSQLTWSPLWLEPARPEPDLPEPDYQEPDSLEPDSLEPYHPEPARLEPLLSGASPPGASMPGTCPPEASSPGTPLSCFFF
ncbi:unnamed protein product [Nesidiocoris tenuis]|uniref:Uncharacterized protein n=1 Tax=Nesidiocoris tenuis TaxID=355587 RepID=A0A6H5G1Q2_9HEMI|nr:unnamed protein product [Nesidiocoris tenuis]